MFSHNLCPDVRNARRVPPPHVMCQKCFVGLFLFPHLVCDVEEREKDERGKKRKEEGVEKRSMIRIPY